MADWRDVMDSRSTATLARASAVLYARAIQDDATTGDPALASLLAAEALCLELRALGMVLDYAIEQHSAHIGPR